MIEYIKYKDEILAIIIRKDFHKPGFHFFTQNDYSQQLAHISLPKNRIISPHVHNPVKRSVKNTLEVLFIKKGKLRVDFYSNEQTYLESRILRRDEVILLISGGHGFKMIDDAEIIEVKQGPYVEGKDKTRFNTPSIKIKIKP